MLTRKNRSLFTGTFRGGLPYARFARGRRPLVVFVGLSAENKVSPTMARMMFRFLSEAYTVSAVTRRPGLPQGYTMADMADDYAVMIREEFGGPVDVIGVSTGGSIALHLAADHPGLVRRLVIHSSAHTLNDDAKRLQLEFARPDDPALIPAALIVAAIWAVIALILALTGRAALNRMRGLPQTSDTVRQIPDALKGHDS